MSNATALPESSRAESTPARRHHMPGEEGTWVFIFGDLVMFSAFLLVFFVNRGIHSDLYETSQATLDQNVGALNTVFLLVSSLFVVLAVRAMRAGRRDLAPRLIAGGMVFGACFLGVKVIEYSDKVSHDLVPATNDFYLYYYLLTGLHAFHVTVGMIVLTVLFFLARKGKDELTEGQWSFFEGGACFWHLVDLLWIFLFPLIYLVH